MGGMKFVGVERRAREARAALNRLRWEADHAIEQGRAGDVAASDLAECAGILTNILTALAETLPADEKDALDQLLGAERERFVQLMAFYTEYHKTAR